MFTKQTIGSTPLKGMQRKPFIQWGMALAMMGVVGATSAWAKPPIPFRDVFSPYKSMRDLTFYLRGKNEADYPLAGQDAIDMYKEAATKAGAPHADLVDQVNSLPHSDQDCMDALNWAGNKQNQEKFIHAMEDVFKEKGNSMYQFSYGFPWTYADTICATRKDFSVKTK